MPRKRFPAEPGVVRRSAMGYLALFLFLQLVAGCSTGIVVHDKDRAAELVVDFLSSLKSDKGIRLSYAWTDDSFKERVSLIQFSRNVSAIRNKNLGAEIRLAGYEIFGPVEIIVVYANSESSEGKIYFRFTLVGTKSKDYYLLNWNTNDSGFRREGIYNEYKRSILIQGV